MKNLFFTISAILVLGQLSAKEGMWIPGFLGSVVEGEMKTMGLKLSQEEIYSVNQTSLKDAIAIFGGGCTSEVISSEGLLLTNHHCGYGRIQSHSSLENDYLKDGFWAMTKDQELPNPGLSVTFVKEIQDVSSIILADIDMDTPSEDRKKLVKERSDSLLKLPLKEEHYTAKVLPFFNGNQYFMIVFEKFEDVRFVGAPPSSIGKYGFDTDNWIWPRHTGDFSLFRIYADENNKPAKYNENNKPYKPAHHLPISLKGVNEGDFTMVYGFPGRTQEYLPSRAIKMIRNQSNPLKIDLRTKKLEILDDEMRKDREVAIKYASKQSSTSNAWKKWKGENRGLDKLDAIDAKQRFEAQFFADLLKDENNRERYSTLFTDYEKLYNELAELQFARDYFVEAGFLGTDILRLAWKMNRLEKAKPDEFEDAKSKLIEGLDAHFKDYDMGVDKRLFERMIGAYYLGDTSSYRPAIFSTIDDKFKSNMNVYTEYIFEKSKFTNKEDAEKFLSGISMKKISALKKDPAYLMATELFDNYLSNIRGKMRELQAEIAELDRVYLDARMNLYKDQKHYPDANSTLRIAFGKVEPYQPRDAVAYDFYTTIDGIIEKYEPESYEFSLPEKLIELYEAKDYGDYGKDGELRVCFIASNHTTGGNSGSPVLNGSGELIGLNFDRNWEGTMSDLMYDPTQCRNIAVDIRYVLFIVDKFAGAKNLIDELSLIK